MATAAGGEKKHSDASARQRWAKENFGSLGVSSPDSCLILRSCVLRVSPSCVLLGDSPASKHMDGFLQESKTINKMKGRMLKTHCKLCLVMTNTISQIAWLVKTLPVSPCCTQSPSGPPESQSLLLWPWGLRGHSAMACRQWPPGTLPAFQAPFPFPTSWQAPLSTSKLSPVPKAQGSPGTHGTPKSPGPPHAQAQLDPSFQPGPKAVGRTAHMETFLVGNLCSFRWIHRRP